MEASYIIIFSLNFLGFLLVVSSAAPEDFVPKFGQVLPEESMSSRDADSMESDHSEDNLSCGPSAFDPKTAATVVVVPSSIANQHCSHTCHHAPSTVKHVRELFMIFLPILQPRLVLSHFEISFSRNLSPFFPCYNLKFHTKRFNFLQNFILNTLNKVYTIQTLSLLTIMKDFN